MSHQHDPAGEQGESFDEFFPERRREEDTDPGLARTEQAAVPPAGRTRRSDATRAQRSGSRGGGGGLREGLLAPLAALLGAVLALIVVVGLVIQKVNSKPETHDAHGSIAQGNIPTPQSSFTGDQPAGSSDAAPTDGVPGGSATGADGQAGPTAPATDGGALASATGLGALPIGFTKCSEKVAAGPKTSCEFAAAVAEKAAGRGGSGRYQITAYSPRTRKNYQLSCAPANFTTCVSDSGASVLVARG